jgi:serine phosphatase RsbU (regulator of sigma subunit)
MIEPIEALEPELLTTSSVLNGIRLSSRIMPAVRAPRGGDWCEAFAVSEDVIALSIGDVCGHGGEKFAAMVALREAIRDAVGYGLNPAQALAEANRFLRRYDPDEYATAVLALLSTRHRSLVFANAGHPAPLMTNPLGTLFLEYSATDLPLGIEDALVPALHRVNVPAATLLVFYTDGVSEHERQPLRGAAQLHDAAIFASQLSALPSAAVIEKQMFLTGSNLDDAAILTAWTPHVPMTRDGHVPRVSIVRHPARNTVRPSRVA